MGFWESFLLDMLSADHSAWWYPGSWHWKIYDQVWIDCFRMVSPSFWLGRYLGSSSLCQYHVWYWCPGTHRQDIITHDTGYFVAISQCIGCCDWPLGALWLWLRYLGHFGQYHVCWCPGFWRHQDIIRHDIDVPSLNTFFPCMLWLAVGCTMALFAIPGSISCLLMPWLLPSPGHHQAWYWCPIPQYLLPLHAVIGHWVHYNWGWDTFINIMSVVALAPDVARSSSNMILMPHPSIPSSLACCDWLLGAL